MSRCVIVMLRCAGATRSEQCVAIINASVVHAHAYRRGLETASCRRNKEGVVVVLSDWCAGRYAVSIGGSGLSCTCRRL